MLDVISRQSVAILELSVIERQALLLGRNSSNLLNYDLHRVDGIVRRDFKCDRLAI